MPMNGSLRFAVAFVALIPLGSGRSEAPSPVATYTFGLSLATGPNNQIFTCFLVKEFEGRVISADPIKREDFILQAQGVKPGSANPEARNFFREYDIKTCFAFEDTIAREYLFRCDPLQDLWKLRFQEYPYLLTAGQHPGLGWAETRQMPSGRQMLLLSDYGILYLTGLCRGENLFRLLHDMSDSSWVDNYRKGY